MSTLILGGGISALSAAHVLLKKDPKRKITLLEKQNQLGGWIQTRKEAGFLFEQGPRTFQRNSCRSLLDLIREVGLEDELIFSDPGKRYLWHQGRLHSIASFVPSLIPSLIREPFVAQGYWDDESIYEFASRRFSPKVATTFFDPLTLGIFAGDIHKLSIRSCFPKFFEWEREKGSVMKGMFSFKKRGASGLFTLRGGMGRLIQKLATQLPIEVVLNCEVEAIETDGVFAGGKKWTADQILSALPLSCIGRLGGEEFSMNSIYVVNLVYPDPGLSKKGFGYLVPSEEHQSLLGMIWDSAVFPQQNLSNETRLTAMVRSTDSDPLQTALQAARTHLGIEQEPLHTSLFFAKDAIPQFEVGYAKRLAAFEERLKKRWPALTLLGNYFGGASVEAAIQRSYTQTS